MWPCWCVSVDSVLACELKGHWFDSQSGHMPGLWARFLVGGSREATSRCFSHTSVFLSTPFLPLFLQNKKIKKKKEGQLLRAITNSCSWTLLSLISTVCCLVNISSFVVETRGKTWFRPILCKQNFKQGKIFDAFLSSFSGS